jgi:hypothetical protein
MRFFTLSSIFGNRETGMVKRLLLYGTTDEETGIHRALMRFAQIFNTDSHDDIIIREGIAIDEAMMEMVTPDAKYIIREFIKTDGSDFKNLEYFTQIYYKQAEIDSGNPSG